MLAIPYLPLSCDTFQFISLGFSHPSHSKRRLEFNFAAMVTKETTGISKVAESHELVPVPSISEGKIGDAALDVVHAAEGEYTPEQYRKLLREIGFIILPLMWICSSTQYGDKVSVLTHATFGLQTDAHLVGQQFSWLSSVFLLLSLSLKDVGIICYRNSILREWLLRACSSRVCLPSTLPKFLHGPTDGDYMYRFSASRS